MAPARRPETPLPGRPPHPHRTRARAARRFRARAIACGALLATGILGPAAAQTAGAPQDRQSARVQWVERHGAELLKRLQDDAIDAYRRTAACLGLGGMGLPAHVELLRQAAGRLQTPALAQICTAAADQLALGRRLEPAEQARLRELLRQAAMADPALQPLVLAEDRQAASQVLEALRQITESMRQQRQLAAQVPGMRDTLMRSQSATSLLCLTAAQHPDPALGEGLGRLASELSLPEARQTCTEMQQLLAGGGRLDAVQAHARVSALTRAQALEQLRGTAQAGTLQDLERYMACWQLAQHGLREDLATLQQAAQRPGSDTAAAMCALAAENAGQGQPLDTIDAQWAQAHLPIARMMAEASRAPAAPLAAAGVEAAPGRAAMAAAAARGSAPAAPPAGATASPAPAAEPRRSSFWGSVAGFVAEKAVGQLVPDSMRGVVGQSAAKLAGGVVKDAVSGTAGTATAAAATGSAVGAAATALTGSDLVGSALGALAASATPENVAAVKAAAASVSGSAPTPTPTQTPTANPTAAAAATASEPVPASEPAPASAPAPVPVPAPLAAPAAIAAPAPVPAPVAVTSGVAVGAPASVPDAAPVQASAVATAAVAALAPASSAAVVGETAAPATAPAAPAAQADACGTGAPGPRFEPADLLPLPASLLGIHPLATHRVQDSAAARLLPWVVGRYAESDSVEAGQIRLDPQGQGMVMFAVRAEDVRRGQIRRPAAVRWMALTDRCGRSVASGGGAESLLVVVVEQEASSLGVPEGRILGTATRQPDGTVRVFDRIRAPL